MSHIPNQRCSICDKEYYACLSCKQDMNLSPWKSHTDSPEHYKIFLLVKGYSTGVLNKKDCFNRLKNIDISDINSYKNEVKKVLEEILNSESQQENLKSVSNKFENNASSHNKSKLKKRNNKIDI